MRALLFLVFICSLLFSDTITFSEEEKAFIESKKTLKVGIDTTWFGFDAIDMNGEHTGISSDYVKLISEFTGLKIEYVALSDARKLVALLDKKEIDLLPALFYTQKRDTSILFTEPYLSLPFYIFSRDDDPHYSSLDSLVGSRVAAPRGYMIVEWLRRNYPGMHVVPSYSIYDGLEMVYRNEVSAFINDYPSTTYVLENSFLPDMGVNAPVSQLSHVQLHMGVRDDMPLLRDIINKINSNLPEKDVEEIRAKWFSKSRLSMLNFSKKEREWIDRNKELTFATDPAWLPFEGYDEQTMQFFGISNDILHLISKRTGLSFKLVDTGSWDEIKEIAKEGRVDMLPTVTPTDELAEYLEFSKPYIKVPFVLFGDKDSQDLSSMEDLKSGSKIAVIENSYIHDKLEAKYKNIEFILLQNKSELLQSVLDRESDFFIDNLASGTYALNSSGDKNIVGLLELPYEYAPSLGLSKDMDSIGLVVINKAIDSITGEEIQRVQDKWVFAEKLKTYDSFAKWSRQYWFVFVGVLVLCGVLLLRYRIKRSD
jgi:ABC-type amino acid transport substrate-binding protein